LSIIQIVFLSGKSGMGQTSEVLCNRKKTSHKMRNAGSTGMPLPARIAVWYRNDDLPGKYTT
ncbi:hypothetical protein DW651_21075, partial [Subdoligranulum sp. AM23-21AC]